MDLANPTVLQLGSSQTGGNRHDTRWLRLTYVVRPVLFLLVSRAAAAMILGLLRPVTHTSPLENERWDGSWYLTAAMHGWPQKVPFSGGHVAQSTLAFFPGFPAVIRLIHVSGLSWAASGAIAALATQVFMIIAVWLLCVDIWGREAADRASLLLCIFPGAFIFSLMYSEALMIGLAAVCLRALGRQQWLTAGLAASFATATRPNAIALVAACAWAAGIATYRRPAWRPLLAVVVAPTGLIAWFAYLWVSTGAKLAWFDTEKGGWGERVRPLAFIDLLRSDSHHVLGDPNQYVPIMATFVSLGLLLLLVRSRVPSALLVYTLGILVLALMSKTLGLRPRFVLTAFPLVAILGVRIRNIAFGTVVAISAMLMIGLLVMVSTTTTLVP
jgi:hypothetical protein